MRKVYSECIPYFPLTRGIKGVGRLKVQFPLSEVVSTASDNDHSCGSRNPVSMTLDSRWNLSRLRRDGNDRKKISYYPSYMSLLHSGELEKRVIESKQYLSPCTVCPRNCRANRLDNQKGVCLAGRDARVSSYNVHYGEEPPISGTRGSGTIFFTGCSLKCRFCQNYPISQLNHGNNYSTKQLAGMMIELQSLGVHNINLVTPTHFVPHIIEAVYIASQRGLAIPLVYNTSGYDSINMLRLLDGIIDIYLPDIKYASDEYAFKYSTVRDYVTVNRQALAEMHRQAGKLVLDSDGIAVQGMIVRHLILPEDIAQTGASMAFIAERLSADTYISLMNQYFPANNAHKFKELARRIGNDEYDYAIQCLQKNGLENGWIQE
jgi:putative pyruvate formate lyase activating enzyme